MADSRWLRYVLGTLLAFVALNAFGGGYYGMAGAEGVPRSLLEGSPFEGFFVPSIILFIVVGGSLLIAALAVFAHWRYARQMGEAAALILIGWICAQVAIVGYVSWMQPAMLTIGAVLFALSLFLSKTRLSP